MSEVHMNSAPIPGTREHLALAVSIFHLADRRLKQHYLSWLIDSRGLRDEIDAFWSAERGAIHSDAVPSEIRERGDKALRICNHAQTRKEALTRLRHDRLVDALFAAGHYYGRLMQLDRCGSLGERFEKYYRAFNRERVTNVDHRSAYVARIHMIEGLDEFPSVGAFAQQLGYCSAKKFVADLVLEANMRSGAIPLDLNQAERLGLAA
jgi:hypothetical protein